MAAVSQHSSSNWILEKGISCLQKAGLHCTSLVSQRGTGAECTDNKLLLSGVGNALLQAGRWLPWHNPLHHTAGAGQVGERQDRGTTMFYILPRVRALLRQRQSNLSSSFCLEDLRSRHSGQGTKTRVTSGSSEDVNDFPSSSTKSKDKQQQQERKTETNKQTHNKKNSSQLTLHFLFFPTMVIYSQISKQNHDSGKSWSESIFL